MTISVQILLAMLLCDFSIQSDAQYVTDLYFTTDFFFLVKFFLSRTNLQYSNVLVNCFMSLQ